VGNEAKGGGENEYINQMTRVNPGGSHKNFGVGSMTPTIRENYHEKKKKGQQKRVKRLKKQAREAKHDS